MKWSLSVDCVYTMHFIILDACYYNNYIIIQQTYIRQLTL